MTRYEHRSVSALGDIEIPRNATGITIDGVEIHYLVPVDARADGVGDPAASAVRRPTPFVEQFDDGGGLDAAGRAGEHLKQARYHRREAAQLLVAEEVLGG